MSKKKTLKAIVTLHLHDIDCEMHAIVAMEHELRVLKAKMREDIFDYYREICYQCKGLGYINQKPCPLCKGYGTGLWKKD